MSKLASHEKIKDWIESVYGKQSTPLLMKDLKKKYEKIYE